MIEGRRESERKEFRYENQCIERKRSARWSGLLMRHALAHDGRSQPRPQIVGQFVEFRIPVDFNGLAGGIANHVTVVAPSQMIVEFGLGPCVQRPIEVVG